MEALRKPWALVLAAGGGTRLRELTTDSQGNSIPKQFCSLNGGASLLQLALHRAAWVAPWPRITTIVAVQHEDWWRSELVFMPEPNVVVQPRDRGTAIGVLLPVLRILARDPGARIVLLPSDHYVAGEKLLGDALGTAVAEVDRNPGRVVLLGMVPDEPDGELGWIVPAPGRAPGARRVVRFVEKPPAPVAAELMNQGGVWNSFILAASGKTLLELFEGRLPGVATTLSAALAQDRDSGRNDRVADVYEELGRADFSRDVLEGQEERLSVLPVPPCGWSDLGTPDRLARCIDGMPASRRTALARGTGVARLDLARACFEHGIAIARQPSLAIGG